MKAYIKVPTRVDIVSVGNDEPTSWTREIVFSLNDIIRVEAALDWVGEGAGYEFVINDIECYEDDLAKIREMENAVYSWANDLTQDELFEMDAESSALTRKEVK